MEIMTQKCEKELCNTTSANRISSTVSDRRICPSSGVKK